MRTYKFRIRAIIIGTLIVIVFGFYYIFQNLSTLSEQLRTCHIGAGAGLSCPSTIWTIFIVLGANLLFLPFHTLGAALDIKPKEFWALLPIVASVLIMFIVTLGLSLVIIGTASAILFGT